MQNMKRLIAVAIASVQILFSFPVIYAFADDLVENIDERNAVICAIEYLRVTQKENIAWYKNNLLILLNMYSTIQTHFLTRYMKHLEV